MSYFLTIFIMKTPNQLKSSKTEKQRKPKQKHNKNVPSKTITYPNKNCICCDTKMKRISATDKYVFDLNSRKRYYAEIYACPNEKCELCNIRMKPAEFSHLAFPEASYGIDVIAKMGILRFREHKSIPEIHKIITQEHAHIEISERHTENLIKTFMVCLEVGEKDPEIIKKKLQKFNIKGAVLSLDGVEPEKGNDILYIVREVQTGEILFAIYLEFSDGETIRQKIIEPVKKLMDAIGLPVLGWVVDKQLALTKAIEKVFPNVPIQHCQSHFLKEIRKPVRDKDSEMNKGIKKTPGIEKN